MSDPKNKWNQPAAPPPPMFFGKKERDLVKQVNDELAERIIGQPIAYYPISLEESNFNEVYGEAMEKVSLPPIRVFAYVEVENEQTNETYGYDYQTKLTVNFSERRITEDQNLYVRVGDFVQYGDYFYEIVRTYNDTRYYFGQVQHKFQISAECVRARDGAFRVMPSVDRPAAVATTDNETTAPAPRPAPYPPLAASYITVNPETKLPNERVLTAGTGINFADTGAGGTLTITSVAGGDGIFTAINGSQAYVTSSLAIGGTTAPDHKISVSGSVSASVNISASAFYGDGSKLSNVTTSPAGATTQLQYNNAGNFAASANLTFNGTTLTGSLTGSSGKFKVLSSSATHIVAPTGSKAGPGSYLALDAQNNIVLSAGDGSTSTPGGATTQIQFNNAGAFAGSSKLTFNGTTLTGSYSGSTAELTHLTASHVTVGLLSSSANVSASAFYGTGSSLSGLTIGEAEDDSYADGLFTDFATTTPVGTAVDRFNEILKALAPGPAPNLDDIDCDDSGASSELSFGSSQAISGYTNVGTAAGFSAVNINGTYSTSTSGNNLRRATFNGSTVIDGDLNEDVSADGVNYPANSFGDANAGDLWLQVNGATLCTASMTDKNVGTGVPGSGTGTDLNGNGSGFYTLSQTGSAEFADGTELDLFQHRTGKYKVVAADQRAGWNYLRVVHTSSTFSRTTNYVEWVNDSNADAITASLSALDSLSMTGDMRLSGVKYHRGGTAQYRTDVGNAYRNVYTSTNISYTVTNGSISSVAMPSISVGSQNEMKILQLTGSLTVDATSILNGSIGASVNVAHPIKSNLSNGGSKTISGILAYNRANNSTTTSETFRRENYRIVSGNLASYSAQANVTDGGNAWNSTSSLVSNDGLLFYNQRLYSPIDGDIPNNGNFSTISNGPGSNVNYSSISGTRTFFRYFTNTGAASQTNFELEFTGDSSTRIVPHGTSRTATKIHVFIKLPNTTTSMTTGWLDLGTATANDAAQLDNFDGCYVGTVPAGGLEINNDDHEATLVTQTVEQNENIVVKIVADAAWTGYISALSISWG